MQLVLEMTWEDQQPPQKKTRKCLWARFFEDTMKFLFLLHINLCKNGPSVHILTDILLFALKKNIYIDVICRGNKNDYDKLNSTIFNNRINFIPVPEKKVKKTRLFKRYLEEIRYARQTYNIYKKQNYDTVFLQSCSASYFFVKRLKKLNCPIVFNVQDIFPNNLFSLQRSKVKRVLLGPFRIIQKKRFLEFNENNYNFR